MRIAYVSFEYPPDSALGGIATYVHQAATLMASRGHSVEVFASSPARQESQQTGSVTVHWVRESHREKFFSSVLPVFAARHRDAPFTLIEGPEYQADARLVAEKFPEIALVVKMHTPTLLLGEISGTQSPGLAAQLRHALGYGKIVAGALRRAQPPPPWKPLPDWTKYEKFSDLFEGAHARQADIVACPCRDLMRYAEQRWQVPPGKIRHVPYPFIPSPKFLSLPEESNTGWIAFFGRLEQRKGVLDLAAAIPLVLRHDPRTRFRFVGRPQLMTRAQIPADELIRRTLGPAAAAVEFRGPVPLDQIPSEMGAVDICVFPSIWENFPCVCLEAMSAARAVIGSSAGGMAEMLDQDTGLLVPPKSPQQIADAIISLLAQPEKRRELGRRARSRVLQEYNGERIGSLMEETYAEAIAARNLRQPSLAL